MIMVADHANANNHGAFYVGAYSDDKEAGGHALGIQILPSANIYRYWGVNTGFYQFDSYAKLKTSFRDYLADTYPEFNQFEGHLYTVK